ncbi:MAG: iron-containing alcohol dehydrogenase [Verrucomicrobiae bacterium]|nr:iron-containing alcohol dehydrogenase [Verrucomicrobiae bacterium]
MISTFSFPTSILYGPGARHELSKKLQALQLKRPLIVTDPGLLKTPAFQRLRDALSANFPIFSEVHPNPMENDVEQAFQAYQNNQCDSVIAFGGGSALDVGKVIRLRIKQPQQKLSQFSYETDYSSLAPFIAIPTTAGTGSEVGRSSVIILDQHKRVFFHPSLLASLVILDPEFTLELPPQLTAATGADALTHCIESFTSPVFHPLCDALALEGIHLICAQKALLRAYQNGNDLEARGLMQLAATMGAIAFQKDLGATHSLAHPLSSLCGLHHGTANALCLPWVMEWNAQRKPNLYHRVGIAMGLIEPNDAETIIAIRLLLEQLNLSGKLRDYQVKKSDIDTLAQHAYDDSCHQTNPVPVTQTDLKELYLQAF